MKNGHNTPIIADSSALVSLSSITDNNHQIANRQSLQIEKTDRQVIVPGEIFSETLNVLGKKVSKEIAIRTGSKIIKTKMFIIAETTLEVRIEALEKFQKQPKSVSFTDCIVMAFADEYETREIFGFDDAFRKNGYIRFGIDKSEVKSSK